MAITSLDKFQDLGHPLTFHIAADNVNTNWRGYSVTPPTGFVLPPNPYNAYKEVTDPDNIIFSTGFQDLEIQTTSGYLAVPLDGGPNENDNENNGAVADGGGFVHGTAPVANIQVKLNDTSVDVDVTEIVKWYLQHIGGNRLKILSKGRFDLVPNSNIPDPYGYRIQNSQEGGLSASESYMITQTVGDISEVVVDENRKATVEFYSFGETADFFPRFNGNYGTGNLTNQISSSDTGNAITLVEYNDNEDQLTFRINTTNANAASFVNRLKTWVFPDTDYIVTSISFLGNNQNPPVALTLSSGSVNISSFSEDQNSVTIVIGDYTPLQGTLTVANNTIVSNLNLTITRPNRNWFEIKRAITNTSGSPAGPFGDVFRQTHYSNINDGSYLYFPSGITKGSASGSDLTINGSATKRFKVTRSLLGGASVYLEIDQNWSPTNSASKLYNINMSSGLYRPKLIITKNSG